MGGIFIFTFQKVGKVMGILTTVNQTLSYEVSKLGLLMKSLLKEVKKHVVSEVCPLSRGLGHNIVLGF